MATVQEVIEAGVRLQTAGQPAAAADLYRRILAVCPDHADAHHLLGLIARQCGDATALARLRLAVALTPEAAAYHNNLGNALMDRRQPEAAAWAYRRARALAPDLRAAHAGLAGTLWALGRRSEAVGVWRDAAAAFPEDENIRNGLANLLQETGEGDAAAVYRSALAVTPGYAAAWANLATLRRGAGDAKSAAALHRRALRLQPDFAAAFSGLGLALAALDRMDEAQRFQKLALAVQPDFAGALSNLGSAMLTANRTDEAITAFRRATRLDPALPDPHRNVGIALLLAGRFAAGWPEYEWRLRCSDSKTPAELPRPRWDGGPLDGRTILLHAEQGMGDVLHFVRYVPMVAARGGQVVLCAPAVLERLLRSLAGVSRFVPSGMPVSGVDVHAPLLSLALAFRTTLADVPAAVPYLHPDPTLVAHWGERLTGIDGFRVGVVWGGSPEHGNDRNRSLLLERLAPLAAVDGVRLVSVQKGPPTAQLASLPAGMRVLDLGPGIADFADTAAILAHLDLLVTVDTSVAHLAGALGRPAWVLLPYAPDWRWLLEREDSPWYPTLRLFRQSTPGAWEPVIARAAQELKRLLGK